MFEKGPHGDDKGRRDYSLLLRRSDAAGQKPDRPFELQNFDESEANLVHFLYPYRRL
jgi:hypothetical protein